ncbi:MAG TPA: ribosome small subunit-dependent GTPase A [Firmicutes bacterium]|nr:ribosome small subunit-dependent GTPase A [Bacillota bacterium]
MEGLLMKGIGGFYYVRCGETIYECRARGVFRKKKITPLVGDFVRVEPEEEPGKGTLTEILPRRNFLVRPPVANLDQLLIVASLQDPQPNLLMIDKTIAAAEYHKIEPVVILNKTDLEDGDAIEAIYRQAGFVCIQASARTGEGIETIREQLRGRVSVFTGNSGVGKSSLLNCIDERLGLSTGEISQKLGRGRHTTRHVEIYELENGGLVADTPGFSTLDIERFQLIRKEELPDCFREFAPFLGQCRFTSCAHTVEKGCAILQAVEEGKIARSRWESYVAMYQEVKDIKEWNWKENNV